MSGKFTTTSSNLFNNNNNKSNIPSWMENLTDNLKIKDHHVELEAEKPKGSFASSQTVYRAENDANLRKIAHSYNETKLVTDSKIQLAKFLSGKYYKVKNAIAGTSAITLDVHIDGVPSSFQFLYEVKNNKVAQSSSFVGNQGEYPFSKSGFEECLYDIKTNKDAKLPKVVEAINKTYVIHREEVVRRFNGSLRQATDRINSLLNDGIIIGADSNRYATIYDVDQLFPQMQKEASEERMSEFHFAPNQEHVDTNEYKHASVLTIEASKELAKHFADFSVNSSSRTKEELLLEATILNKGNNVRSQIALSFAIVNEKVAGIKLAKVGDKVMNFDQLMEKLNSSSNVLNQWQKQAETQGKRLYDKAMFNISDVKERLNKVISTNKIERVIQSWVAKDLITQVDSNTFTTQLSFEDLLSRTKVANVLTEAEVEEINNYERHFGSGLEFERDEKQILKRVREASDAETSDQIRLNQLQSVLAHQFKNFKITAFRNEGNGSYRGALNFTHNGVRNGVDILADFSNGLNITASVDGKQFTVDKLSEAFEKSPVLAAYLSDARTTSITNNIILDMDSVRRTLANFVGPNEIESAIQTWLKYNIIVNIGENKYASNHSFEELLQIANVSALSESELSDRIARQKRDRGMEIQSAHVNDTGNRQVEETWSPERMTTFASSKIGSVFKQFDLLNVKLNDDSYSVRTRVVNPKDGLVNTAIFKFSMVNGIPKDLINLDEVMAQIETMDEAVKEFAEFNKVAARTYKNIINRTRLESQLRTIASDENIPNLIDSLVLDNTMQKLNSNEFASEHSMSEIVRYLSANEKTNVAAAREQRQSAVRNDYRLDLNIKHDQEPDMRVLEAKSHELSPQMVNVKEKLKQTIAMVFKSKKISASMANQLNLALDNSKVEKDLDVVSKQLKSYLQ